MTSKRRSSRSLHWYNQKTVNMGLFSKKLLVYVHEGGLWSSHNNAMHFLGKDQTQNARYTSFCCLSERSQCTSRLSFFFKKKTAFKLFHSMCILVLHIVNNKLSRYDLQRWRLQKKGGDCQQENWILLYLQQLYFLMRCSS